MSETLIAAGFWLLIFAAVLAAAFFGPSDPGGPTTSGRGV